ncbi:MAG: DUF3048 domain-containing protein [Acidimicrobiales bacterium]
MAFGTAGAVSALALASCSSGAGGQNAAAAQSARADSTSTTATTAASNDCPLTGAPVPGGGTVPKRTPIGFKVDNYPTARPQAGLDKADVVFEEPVEGGITRYVAVFQCQGATLVGPVRSARNIDIGILGQLGHPLLAHVGGIQPVISDIDHSPLINFDLGAHTSIITHVSGRYAPYDTYTTPIDVWNAEKTKTTVPQPLFSYSSSVPAGNPAAAVSIPFSRYAPVHWHYDAQNKTYLRYYGTTPDNLSTGNQNSAANVVVQFVHTTLGPWLENSTGGLEVQANLSTNASGQALVFRNGVEVKGKWSRSSLSQPTQFTTTSGSTISLQPGDTWVELVPSTVPVTTTPGG